MAALALADHHEHRKACHAEHATTRLRHGGDAIEDITIDLLRFETGEAKARITHALEGEEALRRACGEEIRVLQKINDAETTVVARHEAKGSIRHDEGVIERPIQEADADVVIWIGVGDGDIVLKQAAAQGGGHKIDDKSGAGRLCRRDRR